MRADLSPKQREYYYNSNAFLNISDGAVRSGKTHVNLARFTVHTQVAPPGDMMILGRTRETVERNAISPLVQMLGARRVRWNRGLGILRIGDRLIWVVGVNDAQAETKIRGSTLAGSYINEVTVLQELAFDQLYDRHSIEGAKMFGDTNPDSPYHWLYRKWLTNDELLAEDLYRLHFQLEDNPYLSQGYVARLKRSHTGLWYRRMVLGQWVAAQGAIYEQWDEDVHVVEKLPSIPEKVVIGVDYGTQNATVFVALGLIRGTWYAFAEYYHSGRDSHHQKTDAEYSSDFREWLAGLGCTPLGVYVDPSAASFKTQLRKDGVRRLRDADNALEDGIRTVSTALTTNKLKVLKICEELRSEFPSWVWNEKKAKETGKEEPLKGEGIREHALDALRYAAMGVLGTQPQRALRVVR